LLFCFSDALFHVFDQVFVFGYQLNTENTSDSHIRRDEICAHALTHYNPLFLPASLSSSRTLWSLSGSRIKHIATYMNINFVQRENAVFNEKSSECVESLWRGRRICSLRRETRSATVSGDEIYTHTHTLSLSLCVWYVFMWRKGLLCRGDVCT
jgi:hypothetical protein